MDMKLLNEWTNQVWNFKVPVSSFNLGDSKESMRLERRYWKIDSLNDHIDEVDGPGKTSKRLDLFHFRWFNIAL